VAELLQGPLTISLELNEARDDGGFVMAVALARPYAYTFRLLPCTGCSHTRASVTKQYNLVAVKGGDALRLGR